MPHLNRVEAWEVLDSRGNPTVAVEVTCRNGAVGAAIVPSGASTGRFEACELRDGDPERYDGRGVLRAVANVNQILGPTLQGMDVREQAVVDARLLELDPTPRKLQLGANALLGVSLAVAQAGAATQGIPLWQHIHRLRGQNAEPPRLPLPMVNMISGGLHAGANLDFQDFLILPVGAADYPQGLNWVVRTYRRLGELLTAAGYEGRLVGDEGGYGPRLRSNAEAAEFIVRAIEAARLRPGMDVALALDVAATHFWDGSHYRLAATGNERLSSADLIAHLEHLVGRFPIISIEDGLAEDDWDGWQDLTRRLGSRVRLVGDDLFVTSVARLQQGLELLVGNAILIKVNQIGTLTETLLTLKTARQAGYACVVSARSGETEDTMIADLAVGAAAEQIKIGCIARSERLAKYNRLLRIAETMTSRGT